MWEVDARHKPRLMEIFQHLHSHPEISWQEFGTRDYLLPILEEAGCRITTFDDCAGIIADWGEGTPKVGVRGDMDALWQEVDGEFCANHSCGHDAHMTVALGTLLNLKDYRDSWSGAVRLVFQPAEEKGAGALKMMEHGAMDGLSHFYGLHVRPGRELANGLMAPAILHGSCASILGKILGDDVHAGRPHLGPNAIEVGAALVHGLGSLHLNPMVPYSVKLTSFKAGGSATNIIPGNGEFSIDFRAQTNEQMQLLIERTNKLMDQTAATFGTTIEHKLHMGTPASEVHQEAQDLMAVAIKDALGEASYHPPVVTGGGDDFHYYTVKKPELKASMLALGCGLEPGLHHPHMTFDREAMFPGIQILTGAVIRTLESLDGGAS